MMRTRVVALLTDFGDEDYFVASLKAVILGVNPRAILVDITHRIPAFDIDAAGFVLAAACPYFPPKTIFLAVVDPGVGSRRKILLVETSRYFFVAPDNGLLTLVLNREKVNQVREISNSKFFLARPSKTFEARDKMAPVVGWLSRGLKPDAFGPKLGELKKREFAEPEMRKGEIRGSILYVDRFGNLITNIPASLWQDFCGSKKRTKMRLYAGPKELGVYHETYEEARKGEVFFLVGSLGLLEVAAREDSARVRTGLRPGALVRIVSGRA